MRIPGRVAGIPATYIYIESTIHILARRLADSENLTSYTVKYHSNYHFNFTQNEAII